VPVHKKETAIFPAKKSGGWVAVFFAKIMVKRKKYITFAALFILKEATASATPSLGNEGQPENMGAIMLETQNYYSDYYPY
jgi:hypothetical protein